MWGALIYFLANPNGLSFLVLFLYFSAILSSLVISVSVLTFRLKNAVLLRSIKTFFSSLTFKKKITFLNFCVFSAFPNLVFVNNGFSFVGNYLLTSVFIVGSFFYPWLILFFLIRLVFVLKSGIFGLLYEHVDFFQRQTIHHVFDGNEEFSKEFITYFYGNVWRAAWHTAKAFTSAGLSFGYYDKSREVEELKLEKEVGIQMKNVFDYHASTGHVLTPTEAKKYLQFFITEAEKKAPLTRFHRSAEDTAAKISETLLQKHFPSSFPKDPELTQRELDLLKIKMELIQKQSEYKKIQEFNDLYKFPSGKPVKPKDLSSIAANQDKSGSVAAVDSAD